MNDPFKPNKLTYLKVKIKSLSIESTIIRKEENRCIANRDYATLSGLTDHRKRIVRPICREANIAYAFLRGIPYKKIEPNVKRPPNWESVDKNLQRFGAKRGSYDMVAKKWKSAYTVELEAWKNEG